MQPLCIALIAYGEFNKLTTSGTTSHRQVVSWESLENFDDISVVYKTGLLIFHGKKAKFRGIFRGKFAEKSPISWDFCGKKVKICGKIGRFRGIFAGKKSKFAEKSAHFAGV